MDFLADFFIRFLVQFQSPTLGFLIGGMLIAALGSKLKIPNPIYQFVVFMLLMKIGLNGGIEIREANLFAMALPAFFSILIGLAIVRVGIAIFGLLPGVNSADGFATAGLFGAVSASTLAVAIVMLEEEAIAFEAWAPALYPFMDIPALILAIVMANIHMKKEENGGGEVDVNVWGIVKESLRGSALSALLLGLALGLFTNSGSVLESFYEPLFRGFLSILMLIMGMEAYDRIKELRSVAHWYAIYAGFAPLLHGLIAFGLGYIAHLLVGFSPGGVIILSVIASSNSDISGPPTLRAGIPSANPSSYIGASTSVGTPVAIAVAIPLFIALAQIVFDI
ncbi:sodium-dependent bicarbonate transport family permease [Rhodohalobacter mucosus]|uniref:Sodium-dependent bicarbonate transport family permease n=1 Tax=Rhodohalobacter mucosus TaxID=2079485 RepID=A0A316TLL2_9BACT|nr:sodium-dependent bicarbonate transport family permease [Rhodohalobacter mucosus]PWN05457.1 sodium-dependent bicarbonate transport family permease [Rhodohalobacter mucosus]